MAIDFPNSPSVNDQHTAAGITWKWDGTTWIAQGSTSSYSLPTASATVLGGVKVGTNLSINASGVLSATASGSPSGSDTHVQFNDGGSFGGESFLAYSKADDRLTTHDLTLIKDGGNAAPLLSMPDSGEIRLGGTANGSFQTIISNSGIKLGRNNNHMFFEWQDSTPGITYKLPIAAPTANGQVLSSTTAGTMSWTGNSGLQSRNTGAATSSGLANNAAGNLTITAAKTYALHKIQTSHAAWVVLYTDSTARTNDAARTETTDPLPGSGIIAEVITSDGATQPITPGTIGWNNEGTPTTNAYVKVVNKSGSTVDLTVTLHFVALEA